MAAESEDLAARYAQLEREAIDHLTGQIPELKPGEAASSVRNMAVSRAVSVDKALLLRGRPTRIVDNDPNNVERTIKKLAAMGVVTIEGEADEVEDAVVDERPELPPAASFASRFAPKSPQTRRPEPGATASRSVVHHPSPPLVGSSRTR